jgi:enoyl-CoA hydratase/carnithine racemase
MDLVLTGRPISGVEAGQMGLVTRVVASRAVVDEALALATAIAAQPPVAVLAAKEAVKLADELPLSAGLRHERRAFFALFASEDQTEGMAAFAEKRRPEWKGR